MQTDFETLTYEEQDGVAWVTLNRPESLNSFNLQMQRELHGLWRALRRHDPVRCVVLTGAGDRAFCTGIDRMEAMGDARAEVDDIEDIVGAGDETPFMFNDPGDRLGPKSCDLWKPVIAAVDGLAIGIGMWLGATMEPKKGSWVGAIAGAALGAAICYSCSTPSSSSPAVPPSRPCWRPWRPSPPPPTWTRWARGTPRGDRPRRSDRLA